MEKFALNINSEKKKLTPEDGLDFSTLGILVYHLSKAISFKDGPKCTLYSIENHGYTPYFKTESKLIYENFIRVHSHIREREIVELRKEEATYANTLKKILGDDKYIEPLDNQSQSLFRIKGNEIEKSVDVFNVITNVFGTVSEIGSRNLEDTRHVRLSGIDYKIFITPAQESILEKEYRKGVVDLKIKQRRSIKTGSITSATLVTIKKRQDISLAESFKSLTNDELSSLGDFNSGEDILTLLRS